VLVVALTVSTGFLVVSRKFQVVVGVPSEFPAFVVFLGLSEVFSSLSIPFELYSTVSVSPLKFLYFCEHSKSHDFPEFSCILLRWLILPLLPTCNAFHCIFLVVRWFVVLQEFFSKDTQ